MEPTFKISLTKPSDIEVVNLLEQLSNNLETRFGSSGKDSFKEWDENDSRFIFIKVSTSIEVIGCGGIRPISNEIGEVKRMYAKYKRTGIGKTVLAFLESEAKKVGYSEIYLETRIKNYEACNFYEKNGYNRIENYGRYIDKKDAACFGKKLKMD
jgi:GNAT superfamily N-acetyltransferase